MIPELEPLFSADEDGRARIEAERARARTRLESLARSLDEDHARNTCTAISPRSLSGRGASRSPPRAKVLAREFLRARARADAVRARAAQELAAARAALSEAEIEIGSAAAEAAGLAQLRAAPALDLAPRSLLGVALPALRARFPVFRALYAPGGTSGSLDGAARAYAALVPHLAALAQEELAVTNLQEALARTNRRWNALDRVLLPNLASEIRRVENDLDEEARDEAFRGRRRARTQSPRRSAALSIP